MDGLIASAASIDYCNIYLFSTRKKIIPNLRGIALQSCFTTKYKSPRDTISEAL